MRKDIKVAAKINIVSVLSIKLSTNWIQGIRSLWRLVEPLQQPRLGTLIWQDFCATVNLKLNPTDIKLQLFCLFSPVSFKPFSSNYFSFTFLVRFFLLSQLLRHIHIYLHVCWVRNLLGRILAMYETGG